MLHLGSILSLDRCPHCGINLPNLTAAAQVQSSTSTGQNPRLWKLYICARCGGAVTACSPVNNTVVLGWFPNAARIDDAIPENARSFLNQALETLHAPSASIMVAASAVDAMLKEKGYREGSLYSRIDEAVKSHLITKEMGDWAHFVRLEANDQRHADEDAGPATESQARHTADFAIALADFLFTLPSKINKGMSEAKGGQ